MKTNTTQIEIDGTKYEVNLDKAIAEGLIKPVRPRITKLSPGDVFKYDGFSYKIIVMPANYDAYGNHKWIMLGLGTSIPGFKNLEPYSNYRDAQDEAIILEHLKNHNAIFAGNIDEQVGEIIDKL